MVNWSGTNACARKSVFSSLRPKYFEEIKLVEAIDIWITALAIIFCVAMIFLTIALWQLDDYYKDYPVWDQSCKNRGGVVVEQYRSNDLCFVNGILVDSYRDGN